MARNDSRILEYFDFYSTSLCFEFSSLLNNFCKMIYLLVVTLNEHHFGKEMHINFILHNNLQNCNIFVQKSM